MQVNRLFDTIYAQREKGSIAKAISSKQGDVWVSYSTEDVINKSIQLAAGLIARGIKKGDRVGIVAYKNRIEWTVADLAIQQMGAIGVPMYPTISPREYEYILNDAEVKLCFVGSEDLFEKVSHAKENVSTLQEIVCFDKHEGRTYWEELFSDQNHAEVKAISDAITIDDIATFIYTSGTTGNPKGVVLTHKNIIAVIRGTEPLLPFQRLDVTLSFLPLCHIFERAVVYCYINIGVEIYFTGTDNLGGPDGDLQQVKPMFFATVPRLLEKVYEKIYNKGLSLTGIKKKLFFWALSLTDDYQHGKKYTGLAALKIKIADKLIFSKWREALGGRMKGIVTGAAACPDKIARVFSAAGIPICEGYGLTETSPTLTVNRYDNVHAVIGTVGPLMDGVELLIDDSEGDYKPEEGEILAYGDNVMVGYYNKPDKTEEVFKEIEGKRWFKTGDVGKLVDGPGGLKYLKITDRKKELLKTSGGKYVAPAPIENKFKEDFLIEQIMVVGERQKFVSALIVPAEEALKDFCDCHDVTWENIGAAIKDPKVIAKYQKVIDGFNPLFSKIEQIKKFELLNCTWDAVKEDGSEAELTPTMKLKRRVILSKYKDAIDRIYN